MHWVPVIDWSPGTEAIRSHVPVSAMVYHILCCNQRITQFNSCPFSACSCLSLNWLSLGDALDLSVQAFPNQEQYCCTHYVSHLDVAQSNGNGCHCNIPLQKETTSICTFIQHADIFRKLRIFPSWWKS